MHYLLLILLIPTMLFSSQNVAQEINKLDAKGKKQGLWIKYYDPDESLIRYKGHFRNDQPVDTFFYFYQSGQLQSVMLHLPDNYSKVWNYSKDSVLISKGRYHNQKRDSSWTYYNEMSTKIAMEFYIEGKKYGLWKVFYYNGNIAEETNWENDMENGTYRQYFMDGTIMRELKYVNGSYEGLGTYYHPNGQLRMEGAYYHDAKEGKWVEYDEEGKLISETVYHRGVPEGGLPVIEVDTQGFYKKDRLDEFDFLPEDEYAPEEKGSPKTRMKK